jgi:hypothetical protein
MSSPRLPTNGQTPRSDAAHLAQRFRDGLRHAYRDRVLSHDIADAQRARINLARDHRGHDVTVSYDPNRLHRLMPVLGVDHHQVTGRDAGSCRRRVISTL